MSRASAFQQWRSYVQNNVNGRQLSKRTSAVTPMSEASDQQTLMLSMASGNQAAFGLIYDHLSVTTFAICNHHLKTPAAVDEAMLGLWLYVWQNAAMLSGLDGSPWSIIIRTAEHHAEFHAQTECLARETDTTLLG